MTKLEYENYCCEIYFEKIRNKNYKITPQRKMILHALVKTDNKHMSIEQIYEIVQDEYSDKIGLATIYRTIQLFYEIGILERLDVDDGIYRYEIVDDFEAHTHHHLICDKCGEVFEVLEDLLDDIEKVIEEKYKFVINNHKLKFYGTCKACSKMRSNNK